MAVASCRKGAVVSEVLTASGTLRDLRTLEWDTRRGTVTMLWFITTETMLFVSLFFGYFYLGVGRPWPMDEPPELKMSFVMLVLLLLSSVVLEWGRHRSKSGAEISARIAVLSTAGMGAAFLVLQALEYRKHLRTLLPTTDAYGSMFYTITGIHGAHVLLGVLMLLYVSLLPKLGPGERPPHRPLHDASLYWHFIDATWVVIVALLYVLPNIKGSAP